MLSFAESSPGGAAAASGGDSTHTQPAVVQSSNSSSSSSGVIITGPKEVTKYVTKEVLAFRPPADIIRIPNGKGGYIRHIFGDLEFEKEENEQIARCLEGLKERGMDKQLVGTVFGDRQMLLRCMQGNNWDVSKAIGDIEFHLAWRQSNLPPPSRSELEHMLRRGAMYVHGRDRCMRPILVMRAVELTKFSSDDALKLTYFWLEFGMRELLIRSRIEQWKVIVDLRDVGYTSFPVTVLKSIASSLQRNYRGRLSGMYLINMPWAINAIWQMVSPLLQETTRKKIKICDAKFAEILAADIHPNQLEKRFGGTQPDVTVSSGGYEYPTMPPPPYADPGQPGCVCVEKEAGGKECVGGAVEGA